jgi:Arc/MetJ family transcription regulator
MTVGLTPQMSVYIIYILIIWNLETYMGKTTIVIDEKLLKDAIDAIGARSKKEAIEAGLRALVREYNREALRRELGTFEMELTLDELERLRNV